MSVCVNVLPVTVIKFSFEKLWNIEQYANEHNRNHIDYHSKKGLSQGKHQAQNQLLRQVQGQGQGQGQGRGQGQVHLLPAPFAGKFSPCATISETSDLGVPVIVTKRWHKTCMSKIYSTESLKAGSVCFNSLFLHCFSNLLSKA